jgi:RNA polymerase sigma factor (sigma-70 family)
MVADRLARTVTRLAASESADADLLRRFVATRDDQAFALIVRRHGPMVFGVCRRTLQHQQDAEDAFQAVFLVLAHKAATVRPNGLSRWLYGVAVRVAHKARARRSRRAAAQLPEVAAPLASLPADWLPLLDAALARLPDRDRGPILLCDLLGRTRAEAAAELGIAEGTLSSRLARARNKLRARLARLGASLSLTTLAAGLADQAAGTVPTSLIKPPVAAGSSAAAARELANGVLRTMFLAKMLKATAILAGVCGAVAVGATWLPTAGQEPPRPAVTRGPVEEPEKPAAKDPPEDPMKRLRKLQAERVEALRSQLDGQFERVKIGKDPMIQYLHAVRELAEAELELADTKESRMAAVEKMVKELTTAEAETLQLQQAGLQTKQGVAQVRAARLKAEIQFEKLKLEK